ncbi:glycosyltransferase family 4 protein [Oceanimonas pelagia]|uniref:Glycosyltransferase family 4 protein n=1 Tax=Oceanimonas pelagia TaxID=3028314 RepID=A0AA50QCU7_9GAMM|nr:glycosyltransferase family 4 protein [Oceanimonas pelagia]WMC11514.1 glycosyltransferase family 4 protein [Oceanimonas pelagia]
MNFAIVSQDVSPGILIFRKDFIIELVGAGYTVYAFATNYNEESRKRVESLGAIPVEYSLSRAGMNPLKDISDIVKLSQTLKKLKIDYVFSFFVKPSIYATLAARLANVPHRYALLEGLGFIHTPTKRGFTFKKRVLQLIQGGLASISYQFARKVFFLNQDDPADLSKTAIIQKSKLHVLGPIGLKLNEYPAHPVTVDDDGVRFVFIARLLGEKGIFEYLAAARLVKQRYPNAEFFVLGGLDPENPAALTSSQLQAVIDEGVITYPGYVDNVHEWITNSHVFVLPSYREGFPRSTQEAMAIGRAVITTDVPGCRETVEDGVNGFLVPPWDEVALAEKMTYFIENNSEIVRMGSNSHAMAQKRFDVDQVNVRLMDLMGLRRNSSV